MATPRRASAGRARGAKSRKIPQPGRQVRGSQTGRPIMAVLDLLGRRSLLRIMWELRAQVLRFRELQVACGELSPTLLNTRLKELRETRLVELTDAGYALTELGRELMVTLQPLNEWSQKWRRALV